jgi:hypothetical protein
LWWGLFVLYNKLHKDINEVKMMNSEKRKQIQHHLDSIQTLVSEEDDNTLYNKFLAAMEKIQESNIKNKKWIEGSKDEYFLYNLMKEAKYPITGTFQMLGKDIEKKYDSIDLGKLMDMYFASQGWKCTFEDMLDYLVADEDPDELFPIMKSGMDIKLFLQTKRT